MQNIKKAQLARYFDRYLEEVKDDWNYITPQQLHRVLQQERRGGEPCFLLDVRKPQDYLKGYISGSTNIFWLDLFKPRNLAKLPQNCLIVVICYLGHTASQVLTLLKLLGYNAVVLKFGMGVTPVKGVPIAGWNQYGYPVEHRHAWNNLKSNVNV